MNEHRRGDKGCSVGLTQWNECARGKIPCDKKDWQCQIRLLVDEVKYNMTQGYVFDEARVAWNYPAVKRRDKYKVDYKQTKYYKETENLHYKLFIKRYLK